MTAQHPWTFFTTYHWLPIGLHSSSSISPTAGETFQKCSSKYHDWGDAPQCMPLGCQDKYFKVTVLIFGVIPMDSLTMYVDSEDEGKIIFISRVWVGRRRREENSQKHVQQLKPRKCLQLVQCDAMPLKRSACLPLAIIKLENRACRFGDWAEIYVIVEGVQHHHPHSYHMAGRIILDIAFHITLLNSV